MGDDELFQDLEGFGDLEDTPDFGDGGDDVAFDNSGEGGGISRTFKIVFGLMAVAVVVIIILLLFLALSGGDKLTATQKTSAAIVAANATTVAQYNATLTALFIIDSATQTAVYNAEITATAEEIIRQTQVSIDATNAASTATAEFVALQTISAAQTATQEAFNNQTATAVKQNTLTGSVTDQQGTVFGGATLRLYRDDGNGQFNPEAGITPVPTASSSSGGASGGNSGGAAAGQPVSYGETVQGTLATGDTALWSFTGAAKDVITVDAIAADPVSMDTFLELIGPDSSVLVGDDDSGDGSNARIADFALPQDGQYTIRVSSVAGAGDYTLMLNGGPAGTSPSSRDTGIVLVSAAHGPQPMHLAQGGSTPTPEQGGDILITTLTTNADGSFDFGSLPPGIYWVELDYGSLPASLKPLVPAGQPVVLKVTVPASGNVKFEIGAPPPTEIPPTSLSAIDMTGTAFSGQGGGGGGTTTPGTPGTPGAIVSLTPSQEPGPSALPTTGFFSDIGDSAGGIGGTSGLTVLAIAAIGLVAVVFIARKLRTSA